MACPNYLPVFQDQIPPHLNGMRADPMGGLNCTCYAAGMAADFDTCGQTKPSGKIIRELTRDTVGGTNLAQVDLALRRYGIDLDTRYRMPWDAAWAEIKGGRFAIIQGGYEVIRRSRFRGSEIFGDNHALGGAPTKANQLAGVVGMDPLCDGRRKGIYRYRGEPYPEGLLREFAGELDFGGGRKLGEGLVYVSFTRDNRPRAYRVGFTPGPFRVYRLIERNGERFAQAFAKARKFRRNTSAPCSRPVRYPLAGRPDQTRLVVRITDGSLRGLYVSVPQEHAQLRVYP